MVIEETTKYILIDGGTPSGENGIPDERSLFTCITFPGEEKWKIKEKKEKYSLTIDVVFFYAFGLPWEHPFFFLH